VPEGARLDGRLRYWESQLTTVTRDKHRQEIMDEVPPIPGVEGVQRLRGFVGLEALLPGVRVFGFGQLHRAADLHRAPIVGRLLVSASIFDQ
jgi:hypothetical protein